MIDDDDTRVMRQGQLLKPCPLCGGASFDLYGGTHESKARIEHQCPIRGFSDSREIIVRGINLEHAVAVWNERPPK